MKNNKYKKNIAMAIIVTSISLLTLTSCSRISGALSGDSDETTSTEATSVETALIIKPISINAASATIGTINSNIQVGGTVSSGNAVAIIGEATGTLKNFSLKVGDIVKADEVIGQIDPSRPGMNYKMKDIKAAIDGTVIGISSEEGSMVAPSVPLGYIEDLSDLSIKVNIIEKYIPLVNIGQTVDVEFAAFSNEVFKGTITDIDPTVNTQTKTLGITIEFEDPEGMILPGMYASNKIIIKTINEALLIPSTSVFAKDNSFYVYTIKNDRIRKTSIVKGLETYDWVQVIEGIEEGAVIVNTRSSLLAEGASVSIQNKGAF
jgi:multidrug efflux pump subunit AcrA (membrane-fusion protein)